MPTVFSHAATGLAIATVIPVPGALGRLVSAGALAAVFPDLDVVAHWLGVPWGHALGHRGSRTRWHSPPCLPRSCR